MGKEKRDVWICDNEKCAIVNIAEPDGSPPYGVHLGRGLLAADWGGVSIPAIYACSQQCAGAAVAAVLEQAIRGEDGQ